MAAVSGAAGAAGERSSPLLVRRILRERLVELRIAAGYTSFTQVAKQLKQLGDGWYPDKVARIEDPDRPIHPEEVRQLVNLYGITNAADVEPFVQMARDAERPGPWRQAIYGKGVPAWQSTFIDLEYAAAQEHVYRGGAIPSLLQTPAYARAVLSAGVPPVGAGELERRLTVHLRRQDLLRHPDDPLALHAVIDEAALRRRVGDTHTMREQLYQLLAYIDRRNIFVQVLREEVHPVLDSPFAVLAFRDHVRLAGLVYIEHLRHGIYFDQARDVEDYRTAHTHLRQIARSPDESRVLIQQYADATT